MLESIKNMMEHQHVPGISIAIIHQNQIVETRSLGVCAAGQPEPVTSETLFQACSISKALTAVATLRLVAAGQLDLDADVNHYLRAWQIPANGDWQPQVTLRELLSHTAGITVPWFAGYHRDQRLPTLIQILAGDRPANTPAVRVNILPGSRFRYAGGGYCIVQQLLCEIIGDTFPALMHRLVLQPAGMVHSSFAQPLPTTRWAETATGHRADGESVAGQWHVYPEMAAAGLWTTAADLARFAIELQRAQCGEPNGLLSPDMAHMLFTPQVKRGDGGQMGLGVWLDGGGATMRFGHPGDNEGFASRWVSLCYKGAGAIILTNSDNGWLVIEEILTQVAHQYGWPEPSEQQDIPSPTKDPSLQRFTGAYELSSGLIATILQKDDALWLQVQGQPPLRLIALDEATFRFEALEGEVTFLFDDDRIHALRLQQDGQINLARRLR